LHSVDGQPLFGAGTWTFNAQISVVAFKLAECPNDAHEMTAGLFSKLAMPDEILTGIGPDSFHFGPHDTSR
jgi:hypothetical protein